MIRHPNDLMKVTLPQGGLDPSLFTSQGPEGVSLWGSIHLDVCACICLEDCPLRIQSGKGQKGQRVMTVAKGLVPAEFSSEIQGDSQKTLARDTEISLGCLVFSC